MTRLVAVAALAGALFLAAAPAVQAQALKERSLSDPPSKTQTAPASPAQQAAPAGQTPPAPTAQPLRASTMSMPFSRNPCLTSDQPLPLGRGGAMLMKERAAQPSGAREGSAKDGLETRPTE